jgi:hypothetical protein
MSKFIVFITLLLSAQYSFSQGYFSVDGTVFNSKADQLGWGVDMSFGGNVKDKGARCLMLGVGVGMYSFTENDPYIATFATFGYFNRSKKIGPYINGRIGYGFYEGSAKFIGVNEYVKGGFYSNVRGGASFRVTKRFYPTPFVGLSLMTLRKMLGKTVVNRYDNAIFNAGVSMIF